MMPLLEEKKIVTTASTDITPFSTAVTKNLFLVVPAAPGYTLQIRVRAREHDRYFWSKEPM